jgi:molybdate transport system permease protein
MSSIVISLTVAAAATLLSLPPAVAAAWYIEKSRLPGRRLLETLVLLPLVLPPVVVGYLLLKLFSPRMGLGAALAQLGIPVAFHWLGAVVAAAVVGFPLFVMMIAQTMKAVDSRYEIASRTLGRSPWSTFWRVTLPLSWPGILSGAALAFGRGLGEFGATIVVAGRIPGETETIPLKIYAELDAPGGEARIFSLVIASIAMCIVCVLISRRLDRSYRRKLELEG